MNTLKLNELPKELIGFALENAKEQVTESFANSCIEKDRLLSQCFDITKAKEGQAFWVFVLKNGYANYDLDLSKV